MSDSGFYRAFEERHRGSRELIMQRATAYRAYIEPLLKIYQPAFLQDLGCGRGEWLEYTEELGFVPHGVDLDEGMLQACIERDLPVTEIDAVRHLKSLADNSQSLVSGFHIAEHIPFDELQQLIKEALRVLKPGGLLILETPNPENLVVGTNNFYMDPTHQRPIPPLLLSFVAEYTGFSRAKILRLQESPELANGSTEPALIDVLGGASPDYAIVAQKVAKRSLMAAFDAAFAEQQGLTLDVLAQRYDEKNRQQLNTLAQRLTELAETEQALNQQQVKQYQELKAELGDRLQQIEALQKELHNLLHSSSWRLTAPLRGLKRLLVWLLLLPWRIFKFLLRPIAKTAIGFVVKRPGLHARLSKRLKAYPRLFAHLRQFAISRGVLPIPVMPGSFLVKDERESISPAVELEEIVDKSKKTIKLSGQGKEIVTIGEQHDSSCMLEASFKREDIASLRALIEKGIQP